MKGALGWNLNILGVDQDHWEFYLMFLSQEIAIKLCQRNWVFATHSSFIIPKTLQSDSVNLWYFKLRLFYLPEFIVWNI